MPLKIALSTRGLIQGMQSEEQQRHQKPLTSADQQEQDVMDEYETCPDKMWVRETWPFSLFPFSTCDCVCIILQRITKELSKLQFYSPGPQMKSHATKS